jgi:hypothetical protein
MTEHRLAQVGTVEISRRRSLQAWVTLGARGSPTAPSIEIVYCNGSEELGAVAIQPGAKAAELIWLITEADKCCAVAEQELQAAPL